MTIKNLWPFFPLLVGCSVLGYGQTIDYHLINALTEVHIEKKNADGSIWYSYITNNTFFLDSLSPSGQINHVKTWPLQVDTLQYNPAHILDHTKGLVVTFRQQDAVYDFGNVVVQRYDTSGTLLWNKEFTPYANDFTYAYKPSIFNDSLFIYGYSQDEGDTSYELYVNHITWQGDSVKLVPVGYCGLAIHLLEQSAYFMHRSGCSLSGYASADVLKVYQDGFQFAHSTVFYDSANSTGGNEYYGKSITPIDTNTFYGYTVNEFDDFAYPCVIKYSNGQQTWFKANELIPTQGIYSPKILSMTAINTGYLAYTQEHVLNNDSVYMFAHQIRWFSPDLQTTMVLFSDTVLFQGTLLQFSAFETNSQIHVFGNYRNYVVPNFIYGHIKWTIPKDHVGISMAPPQAGQLHLYPIPASHYLYVTSAEQGIMQICNLQGKVMGSWQLSETELKLDISFLENGVYLVTFLAQNRSVKSQKLIINH